MVKLIAHIDAKPGQQQTLVEALRDLSGPSRAEPGCVHYDAFRMRDDPTKLVVIEEWASQEALDAHMATPHFQAFVAKMGEALVGPPKLEFLEPL